MLGVWLAAVWTLATGPSVESMRQDASAALPPEVALQERTIAQRATMSLVEARAIAPTGLPIADRSRWFVHEGSVRGVRSGAPILATGWSPATRTASAVEAMVEAEGYRAIAAHAEHRPSDGSVRWRVDVGFDPATGRRPLVWVDDVSGVLLVGPDQVRGVSAAAFARNPVLDDTATVFELVGIDDPAGGLADGVFDVRQCADPGAAGACVLDPVTPTEADDFVFAAPRSDADHARVDDRFSAASIAVHAQRYSAFAEEHGLPMPPCIDAGAPGVLVANYRGFTGGPSIRVANAGYTGDCSFLAFFGQGPAADWGYDADVVAHELAHGTIAARLGEGRVLGLARRRAEGVVEDAGAIGEALADFVAAVLTGDPGHAEYVRAYDGGAARNADNALRCPSDLVGQIHADSEPLTAALWEAHAVVGDALVGPVMDAVAMLEEDATFEEAADAMLMMTEAALGAEARAALETGLLAHGLLDCERISTWQELRGPLGLWPRFGARGRFEPMRPPPMQIRVDVPADAVSMTVRYSLSVVPDPGWAPVGDLHVLVQAQTPVEFSYVVDDEGATAVEATPDLHVASINDGEFELDVDPGSTQFLAFFNQGQHLTRVGDFEVSFELDEASSSGAADTEIGDSGTSAMASTDTSSGGEEASANGAGAGCRTTGPLQPWSLLWVFGACAGVRRGRRRSRGGPGSKAQTRG
ncbi:MAG: hypothetical protein ACRBN8_03975 [Nannocystales bacterium]